MRFSVEDLGEQARAVLAGLSFSGSDVVLCAELRVFPPPPPNVWLSMLAVPRKLYSGQGCRCCSPLWLFPREFCELYGVKARLAKSSDSWGALCKSSWIRAMLLTTHGSGPDQYREKTRNCGEDPFSFSERNRGPGRSREVC